jgi:hypothetical protein
VSRLTLGYLRPNARRQGRLSRQWLFPDSFQAEISSVLV